MAPSGDLGKGCHQFGEVVAVFLGDIHGLAPGGVQPANQVPAVERTLCAVGLRHGLGLIKLVSDLVLFFDARIEIPFVARAFADILLQVAADVHRAEEGQ